MSTEALRQRLAAILAADAAGYSRLMAADERATVAALDAARAIFRSAEFTDLGEQTVKNIAEAVRAFKVKAAGRDERPGTPAASVIDLSLPDKPSIAVLPFENMSGDPEYGYFGDGLAEDVITALSKISSLFVIARNSGFSYKGQATDVRRISKELGVRHVLEGSVRASKARIRVTAQCVHHQIRAQQGCAPAAHGTRLQRRVGQVVEAATPSAPPLKTFRLLSVVRRA